MRKSCKTISYAVTVSLGLLTAASAGAQQAIELTGDPVRGKIVYRNGGCVNCHGWAADGKTGVGLKDPDGPSLRETTLDRAALIETIRCGRPGTAMPYHDRAAYRDDRCYGMVMADFDPDSKPSRGRTFGEQDLANIVAYLQADVIGLGRPTFDECTDFFDNPAARACGLLK